jgi:RNA polymerase sigma-70 factor (ECF subfamily)
LSDADLDTLFRRWLDEHAAAVWKIARAYTASAEDCQDLVQEILLQVWRSLPQFNGRSSAATWAYRVALNTALTWQRKAFRRKDLQPLLEIEDPTTGGLNATEKLSRQEAVNRLYAAIRRLPKSDAALMLLFLDDLSYREMAEVLGITETNVGVKLNRAKKAIGELLRDDHES